MRDHWSIGFVAERMDSQFERDIGLLRQGRSGAKIGIHTARTDW